MAWRSNLKLKLLASYFGQTYVTLVGVIIAPLYLKFLGAEGYGLIGIFTLMQSWMSLLDLGLSPTLARETARFNAGQGSPAGYRALVDTLSRLFLISCLVFAAGGLAASPWVARHWLKLGTLAPEQAMIAVAVMVLTVALRWRTEPYRSILIGFERLVWVNGFNSFIATLRFGGAALLLAFVNRSVGAFFIYQLVIALLEAGVIIFAAHRLLPRKPATKDVTQKGLAPLRPLLKFSTGVAVTSAIWLFISQFDKLVLSTILPLKTYGVFTLATVVAGGISLLSGPVSQVVLPRLTALNAAGDDPALLRLYCTATAFISALVAPAALLLALFGGEIVWTWTGNREVAAAAWPILRWYAVGNGLLAVTAFSYYLQYAHGDLKLHVRGNAVFALVLVPAVLFAAVRYGAVGAGMVWAAANLFYLLGWTYLVHARFSPGLHWRWLGRDVILVSLPAALVVGTARLAPMSWYVSRTMDLAMLAVIGVVAFAGGAALVPGAFATLRAFLAPRATAP